MKKFKGLWIELEDRNNPGFFDIYPLKMDESGEWYVMFSFMRVYLKNFPDKAYLGARVFTELWTQN